MAALEGIITGLLANLLTAAGTPLIVEIQRRQNVFRAIRGEIASPSELTIQKAFLAIEQSFGRLGKLDTDLHAFLKALTQSELIKPLALAAYAGVDCEPLQYCIYSLYIGAVKPTSNKGAFEACKKLTEKIVAGIRVYLKQADVSTQLDLLTELNPDIRKEAGTLVAEAGRRWALRGDNNKLILRPEIINEKKPWLFCKPNDLDELIKVLSRAVREEHEKLIVAKPNRQRAIIAFNELYVPNRIELSGGVLSDGNSVNLIDFASDFSIRFPATVVLGNPGGGKSTLAQAYALVLSKAGAETGNVLLIHLRVREIFAAMKDEPSLSILNYIVKNLARVSERYQFEELINPVRNLLYNGRCICIFDGLDEVITVSNRIEIVTKVSRFISEWSRCSFLVTSRPQGYAEAPLSRRFQTAVLQPFNRHETTIYFEKFSRAVFEIDDKDLGAKTERFLAEASRIAPDLMETPLLLSLIIWLFHSTNRIPDNRLEVYYQCATLLFDDWDRSRNIDLDLIENHRLWQLLPVLAGDVYVDPILANNIPRQWLRQKVARFFKNVLGKSGEGRSNQIADEFISHLVGRAWVLTEKAPDRFEFTHRSFLEYFFAKHLDEKYESVSGLMKVLLPHIISREWTVPSHVALQLRAERGIQGANRCSKALISAVRSADTANKPNLVLFAAEACEYLQPSNSVIEEISQLIVSCAENESYWSSAFLSLLQVQTGLRDSVYRGVASGLISLLSMHHGPTLAPTVDWLVALRLLKDKIIDPISIPWLDRAPDAFERISDAVEQKINFSHVVLPMTLKALFDLTGQLSEVHSERYSHLMWSASARGGRYDWRLVDFILMRAQLVRVLKGKIKLDDAPYARLALLLSKNTDRNVPEFLETRVLVWPVNQQDHISETKFDIHNDKLVEALRLMNAGIRDFSPMLGLHYPDYPHPDFSGPIIESRVFDFITGGTRTIITPREILLSYVQYKVL